MDEETTMSEEEETDEEQVEDYDDTPMVYNRIEGEFVPNTRKKRRLMVVNHRLPISNCLTRLQKYLEGLQPLIQDGKTLCAATVAVQKILQSHPASNSELTSLPFTSASNIPMTIKDNSVAAEHSESFERYRIAHRLASQGFGPEQIHQRLRVIKVEKNIGESNYLKNKDNAKDCMYLFANLHDIQPKLEERLQMLTNVKHFFAEYLNIKYVNNDKLKSEMTVGRPAETSGPKQINAESSHGAPGITYISEAALKRKFLEMISQNAAKKPNNENNKLKSEMTVGRPAETSGSKQMKAESSRGIPGVNYISDAAMKRKSLEMIPQSAVKKPSSGNDKLKSEMTVGRPTETSGPKQMKAESSRGTPGVNYISDAAMKRKSLEMIPQSAVKKPSSGNDKLQSEMTVGCPTETSGPKQINTESSRGTPDVKFFLDAAMNRKFFESIFQSVAEKPNNRNDKSKSEMTVGRPAETSGSKQMKAESSCGTPGVKFILDDAMKRKFLESIPQSAAGKPNNRMLLVSKPDFIKTRKELNEWYNSGGNYKVFKAEAYEDIIPEISDFVPKPMDETCSELMNFVDEHYRNFSSVESIKKLLGFREKALKVCFFFRREFPQYIANNNILELAENPALLPEGKLINDENSHENGIFCKDNLCQKFVDCHIGPDENSMMISQTEETTDTENSTDDYEESSSDENMEIMFEGLNKEHSYAKCPWSEFEDNTSSSDFSSRTDTQDERKLLFLLQELKKTNNNTLRTTNKIVARLVQRRKRQSFEKKLEECVEDLSDKLLEHFKLIHSKRRNKEDLSKMSVEEMNPGWQNFLGKLEEHRNLHLEYQKFLCERKTNTLNANVVQKVNDLIHEIRTSEEESSKEESK